ncbi:MAG: glycoside hydrolase family 78 protein [Tannerellaceae bacterium]|nr:glycoside hydrolase family 78 protein [Tannerellaceae bacterium]
MKYKLYLPFVGISLLGLLLSCNQQDMQPSDLRCEYLENPIAIESLTPLLSWKLQSGKERKSQTAFQVLAASRPELLIEGKADCWDSGKILSSQSVQVQYKGEELSSRQDIYWKVRIWDEQDNPTSWSEIASWSMGLLHSSDWKAQWIAYHEDLDPNATTTYPAPYFRKLFTTHKPIRQAKAYICGLGFYELYLNGQKVGDQVLAPAVTNYDKRQLQHILYYYDDQSTQRALYNTFDVTNQVTEGDNTIGVILGNGWYNQRSRTVEGDMWYDTPRLLFQLEIEYVDGSAEMIATDNSWKCLTGPLLHDAIFTGEIYDARLEMEDWNNSNFDDANWKEALTVRAPTGSLHTQLAPADKITRVLIPGFKGRINDSTYLYTLPEMISGWAELNVKGEAGNQIRLRFISEEKDDYGQFDTYILKGGVKETWEPRFTWHAFRYVEVITSVAMDERSIRIKVVNTEPAETSSFACSNDLFNAIHDAYILTQRGNFHGSISSDCPHRERLAYTGDGQVIVESSLFTFDMTQFYRKWFNDMANARNKKTGYVPHTAPFAGGGGGPAWGSAYVIMPWAYFCYYGDTTLLREHYEGMKQWVTYLTTRTDDRGIVVREEPNGWCLGDWCTPGKVEIPEPLVNTAYYYHSADLVSKIAHILGKKEDNEQFNRLKEKIKADYNAVFFNAETNHYWEGRQGADVFPLAFDIVPEQKKEAVLNALVAHLESINYHFDTGILATPLLLKVLTDNNYVDLAYRLMNQRSFPGFSYLLDDSYTCLWENWDGSASRDHPMFGSVVAWFYHSLAGIRYDDEQPGMKHIVIAPQMIDELSWCKASWKSLYGIVRSEWKKQDADFELTIEIPFNTTATVYLPNKENNSTIEKVITSGIHHFTIK